MNPSSNEAPSLHLPPPVAEQLPDAPAAAEIDVPKPEKDRAVSVVERAPTPGQTASVALPAIPLPGTLPVASDMPVTDSPIVGGTSVTADDGKDIIEKEWVNKAKQIVERTRDDPYQQSEQLTLFKADYMKQRYNKTINTVKAK
jgi:hypothetical protein